MATNGANPPTQITNAGGAIPVYVTQTNGASAIVSGQQTATASAVALPNKPLLNSIRLLAPSGNTGTIAVGPAGVSLTTGYVLAAGMTVDIAISNTNLIYMIGSNTTDKLYFVGS